MENLNQIEKSTLTDQELECLIGFFDTLKNIYNRLIREGYTVINGEIIPPINNDKTSK